MKIIFTNFFIILYATGTIVFPMSDFGLMGDMPRLYENCKDLEDKDMTVVDFFTDHLLNFDCMIDDHQNGDSQKPHKPIKHNNYQLLSRVLPEHPYIEIGNESPIRYSDTTIFDYGDILYSNHVIFSIFHPPIIA
uniref:hypothetical protein n=1 Tax=Mariniflexile sp. TaxID=1979402 RepID=UPI0040480F69